MAPKKAAASASKSQKGLWTKSALEVKSQAKLTHTALLAAAVEYCNEHKCGGRIAVKDPEFEGKLTYHQIDYARAYPDTDRNKYDVLTAKELIALKTWIRASEAKNNPVPSQEVIGQKVREFLVARASPLGATSAFAATGWTSRRYAGPASSTASPAMPHPPLPLLAPSFLPQQVRCRRPVLRR